MTRRFFVSIFSALGLNAAAARIAPVASTPQEGYGILRFKTIGDGFWFAPTFKRDGKTWILGSTKIGKGYFDECEKAHLPWYPYFKSPSDYFASRDKSVARSYLKRAVNQKLPDHWTWLEASKTDIF